MLSLKRPETKGRRRETQRVRLDFPLREVMFTYGQELLVSSAKYLPHDFLFDIVLDTLWYFFFLSAEGAGMLDTVIITACDR